MDGSQWTGIRGQLALPYAGPVRQSMPRRGAAPPPLIALNVLWLVRAVPTTDITQ